MRSRSDTRPRVAVTVPVPIVCAACDADLDDTPHVCPHPTSMFAGATTPKRPPAPPFPLTASAAFDLAAWYLRYGLDQISSDPRCSHKAVECHAKAALAQHDGITAAIALASEAV